MLFDNYKGHQITYTKGDEGFYYCIPETFAPYMYIKNVDGVISLCYFLHKKVNFVLHDSCDSVTNFICIFKLKLIWDFIYFTGKFSPRP